MGYISVFPKVFNGILKA